MSDLLTFALRLTFVCPICKTLNDQDMSIKATSWEAAQDAAQGGIEVVLDLRLGLGHDFGAVLFAGGTGDHIDKFADA